MGVLSILILIINDLIDAMDYQLMLILVTMIILSIISLKMIPLINNARDMGEEGKTSFDRLHLVSVMLNVITLLIGLALLFII